MFSKFEIYFVIQKIIIIVLLSIILNVFIKIIKIIIFMSFKIIIFILFKRNCRYRYYNHHRNIFFICILSIIIVKHQYSKTTLTGFTIDRIYAYICIYNLKYFVQSKYSFLYIFIDYVLLDF